MDIDQALHTFVEESRELLSQLEEALLYIEIAAQDEGTVNAMYRAAHTIKGSAGLFALAAVVAFTHLVENEMDKVRSGALRITPDLAAVLLPCCDNIGALISESIANDGQASAPTLAAGELMLQKLCAFSDTASHDSDGAKTTTPAHVSADAGPAAAGDFTVAADTWHLSLRFGADVLRNGMDPASFLRYLGKLGTLVSITTVFDELPDIDAMDPESCYVGFEIDFKSTAGKNEIEDEFEFVRDDCKLRILPPNSRISEFIRLIDDLPRSGDKLGALLVKSGALTQRELDEGLAAQQASDLAAQPLGHILVSQGVVHQPVVNSAIEKQKQSREQKTQESRLIRVQADKLDALINLVGEHGIEPADVRRAHGKSVKGQLRLNAYHDSGSIVIEVSDDGGGLDKHRILQKAIDKGLVAAHQELGDKEIFNLLFEAGFSTAEQVSNLSGRGVGMDVVRRNSAALRGAVDLDSEKGVGTTVRIRLPLTLAIIDGFQVGVGKSDYVVPLDLVLECVELSAAEQQAQRASRYLTLRGEVLPFIRLRELFEIDGPPPRRESIVLLHYAGQRAGLVLATLVGELQAVIKSIGKLFSHLKVVAGSTILGSGDVALILDVPALVLHAISAETHTASRRRAAEPAVTSNENHLQGVS